MVNFENQEFTVESMERNEHKTDSIRELGAIDILPLLNILPQLVREWDKEEEFEVNHNKKMSLSQVQHINFRWSDKQAEPVRYFDLPLWDKYKDVLLPIMQKTVQPLGYEQGYFPRVMLAKMLPGTVIPEHIDGHTRGWIAHKIHIPLITNEQVTFSIAGILYHFAAGKAYEVNNGAPHAVSNLGDTARIHFIFEYLDAAINDVPCVDVTLGSQQVA